MRLTKQERQQRAQQALSRAVGNVTMTNYPAIIEGFMEKGIPAADILPRENVFTFEAWRALGRTTARKAVA